MLKPSEVADLRGILGLTQDQLALLIGYTGSRRRQMMHDIEHGRRQLRLAQHRLLVAYLDGYRPDDWPIKKE